MFERFRQGAVDVIRGKDSLTVEKIKQVSKLLDECVQRGQPRIVFDLEEVPLIDGAGLEMLLDVWDRCLKRGGVLKLSAPNPLCREILSITDVGPQFEIFGDTLSAAGSFAR